MQHLKYSVNNVHALPKEVPQWIRVNGTRSWVMMSLISWVHLPAAVSIHLFWEPWPITRKTWLCKHSLITKTAPCDWICMCEPYLHMCIDQSDVCCIYTAYVFAIQQYFRLWRNSHKKVNRKEMLTANLSLNTEMKSFLICNLVSR